MATARRPRSVPDREAAVGRSPGGPDPDDLHGPRPRLRRRGLRRNYTAEAIRLDAGGTPDASFGTGGFEQTASSQTVAAIVVQPDGKVILAGETVDDLTSAPVLTRIDADGAADPSFRAVFDIITGSARSYLNLTLHSVLVQPDGKILVGGTQPITSSSSFAVARFLPDGSKDAGFGVDGEATFRVAAPPVDVTGPGASGQFNQSSLAALALAPDGKIVVAGSVSNTGEFPDLRFRSVVARLLPIALSRITPGDYTGDGKADPAAYIPSQAVFAYRKSDGTGDVVEQFGIAGAGQDIPAPGDYDGDRITDLAVYLPSLGSFALRLSAGGPDQIIPFGIPGAGGSIPVPGDYDGSGRTELAVYLPSLGAFAYRPAAGGADVIIPFGFAGAGQSIPAPGDYTGDGSADLAVYLPSQGVFAYRPSGTFGSADVLQSFGAAGPGGTLPAPGDYDGDGRTDVAAYLPSFGLYAYRPTGGGADVVELFGVAGAGQTIPGSSVVDPADGSISASATPASSGPAIPVPLTDDMMPIPGMSKRKVRGSSG